MKELNIKFVLDNDEDMNKLISAIAGLKEDIPFIFEVFEVTKKK